MPAEFFKIDPKWDPAQEALFLEMAERRRQYYERINNNLIDAVKPIGFSFLDSKNMAENLKDHADALVAALQPFCKDPK